MIDKPNSPRWEGPLAGVGALQNRVAPPRARPDVTPALATLLSGLQHDGWIYGTADPLGAGRFAKVFMVTRRRAERMGRPMAELESVAIKITHFTPVDRTLIPRSEDAHILRVEQEQRRRLGPWPTLADVPELIQIPLPEGGLHLEGGYRLRGGPGHPNALNALVIRMFTDAVGIHPRSLSQLIGDGGVRTSEEHRNFLHLARELTNAVLQIHAVGAAHGDIKPANVTLRMIDGRWRDVRLVDFASVRRRGVDLDDGAWVLAAWDDLGALTLTLVEVLLGAGAPWRTAPWPLSSSRDAARDLLDPYRAPGALRTAAAAIVAEARRAGDRDAMISLTLRGLSDMLGLVGKMCPREALSQFARHQDELRDAAAEQSTPGRGAAACLAPLTLAHDLNEGSAARDLPHQLQVLASLVSSEDLGALIDRYQTPLELGEPRSLEHGVALWTRRRSVAARAELEPLLEDPFRTADTAPVLVRKGLATLTQILVDEEETEGARDLVRRYRDHPLPEMRAWADLLGAVVELHATKDPLERLPSAVGPRGTLADTLRVLVTTEDRLRRGLSVPGAQLQELTQAAALSGAPVLMCLAARTEARALARGGDVGRGPRFMPALLRAVAIAAQHGLVVELERSLRWAAQLSFRLLATPQDRANLEARGVDARECLVAAAGCALTAARIASDLGHGSAERQALTVAADCLSACGGIRRVEEAVVCRSLAYNNATLRGNADPSLAQALEVEKERWAADSRRTAGTQAGDDPGLYRRGLFLLSALAALPAEAHSRVYRAARFNDALAPTDLTSAGMLQALLDQAGARAGGTLLNAGAGLCLDAMTAARAGFHVTATEPEGWLRSEGRERVRRAAACEPTVVEGDALVPPGGGTFDVVLSRELLTRASRRVQVLQALGSALSPGGVLLATAAVQRRPASPGRWRDILGRLWVTDLSTAPAMRALLTDLGFTDIRLTDRTPLLHEYYGILREELEGPDGVAGPLALPRRYLLRALEVGIEATAEDGPLGYLFVTARRG